MKKLILLICLLLIPFVAHSANKIQGVTGSGFTLGGSGGVVEPWEVRDYGTGETFTVRSGGVSRRTFGSMDYLIIIVEKTQGD